MQKTQNRNYWSETLSSDLLDDYLIYFSWSLLLRIDLGLPVQSATCRSRSTLVDSCLRKWMVHGAGERFPKRLPGARFPNRM